MASPIAKPLRVFFLHAQEDRPIVEQLHKSLKSEKWIEPRLSNEQADQTTIKQKVAEADVIIICLSTQMSEGYFKNELRYVYDKSQEKPEGTIYLIPLRLEEGSHISNYLRSFQWVDYFGDQKQNGYLKLLDSLRLRHEQIQVGVDIQANIKEGNQIVLERIEEAVKTGTMRLNLSGMELVNLAGIIENNFNLTSWVYTPWSPSSHQSLNVFLCYASDDKPVVKEFYKGLKSESWIDPWWEEEKILPGQEWDLVIRHALYKADTIIICLSNRSVQKEGYVQKEIRYAYDVASDKIEKFNFLIPLRLDEVSDIPSKLQPFQLVNYFGDQKQNEYLKLLDILRLQRKQKILDLSHNQISVLPAEIGKLINLTSLDLSYNKLESLPVEILELKNLQALRLDNNPLPIPPEILEKVTEPRAILDYYFSRLKKALNECKVLIVGQGSVGKTSLTKRIISNDFNKNELKTEGISIEHWQIRSKSKRENSLSKIQLNLWDFGGQEIMHATHQFFLTKRSLYLLVLDSRLTQEENRVEYWLKIIQSFGGESPVLIVGNKIDQHPLDIDRTGLQKKYPNIVGVLETSAATGAGIEELKTAITEQVNSLPHVRDLLPENWFTVKTKLEELGKQSNFITQEKYLDLCNENEVSDETSQRTLIGFLHDLGVVLYFQDDPRLEALGILNPQWVTNGVYKILNSHTLFQNKGVLTTAMLDEILNLPEYPRGKRLFIVDMMKKFELCYDIDGDTFLVPDLLPKDEPYTGEWDSALAFKYAYGVLPSSIMSRFIVKIKDFVHQPSTWRSGTILKKDNNTAFVKADFEDKTVTIKVQGSPNTRRDTLSFIRGAFEMIHKSVARLEMTQQVPHPQYPSLILDYEELIEFEREGVEDFPRKVDGKVIKVNVREMLNGIESENQRKEKTVINYNYYGDINTRGDFIGRDKNTSAGDHSIVIDGNVSDSRISASYAKIDSAEIDPVLKNTLLHLGKAVDAMLQILPNEQSTEVTEDFSKLTDEAIKPKPNQKWYSVSIEGLIKAAENLDKLGTPVISLSRKVLSLLTDGVVK